MPKAPPLPAELAPVPAPAFVEQLITLTSRYARLQWADRMALLLQFAQAPIIALMIAATFGDIRKDFNSDDQAAHAQHATDTKLVLFVMTIAVLWCSGTASVREVVKELPIVGHEVRYGVNTIAYLLSKFLFLSLLALLQAGTLLIITSYFTQLTGSLWKQFLILGGLAVTGVALGLLISSLVSTTERAMTILPVALIGLAIYSSGLARLKDLAEYFAWFFSPAYWCLAGLTYPLDPKLTKAQYTMVQGASQTKILGSGESMWLCEMILLIQALILLIAATEILSRRLRRSAM